MAMLIDNHQNTTLIRMNSIIQIQDLSRSFGSNCAINGVSFTVEEGEVFGLLGPNGSGKTTLVRLLNGVLAPTSGTAMLFDRDVMVDGALHPCTDRSPD